MSVQTNVQLYQNAQGVGVISQANPYDTASYVVDEASVSLAWGVFCKRGSAANTLIELSSNTDELIGATFKQLNRVEDQFGGLYKSTDPTSTISFELTGGVQAGLMRMGYLFMPVVGSWTQGDYALSVRIVKEGAAPFGILGEVSATAAASQTTPANWATLPVKRVIFADSTAGQVAQIASVYFDFRFPEVVS